MIANLGRNEMTDAELEIWYILFGYRDEDEPGFRDCFEILNAGLVIRTGYNTSIKIFRILIYFIYFRDLTLNKLFHILLKLISMPALWV